MGSCNPGYYCDVGSSNRMQHACGNASVYCPRRSPSPRVAHEGFYTAFSGVDAGERQFWDVNNSVSNLKGKNETKRSCDAN
jgi:hypothetical protein